MNFIQFKNASDSLKEKYQGCEENDLIYSLENEYGIITAMYFSKEEAISINIEINIPWKDNIRDEDFFSCYLIKEFDSIEKDIELERIEKIFSSWNSNCVKCLKDILDFNYKETQYSFNKIDLLINDLETFEENKNNI